MADALREPPMSKEMHEGQRVEVRLIGNERWYTGVVLDRPRKLWVQLEDYGSPMIADENNIAEWRTSDEP